MAYPFRRRGPAKGGRRRTNRAFFRIAVVGIIVFITAVSAARYAWQAFKSSDYFKIKDITVSQNLDANPERNDGGIDLSYLKGENIFTADLNKQARYLSDTYPIYKKIKIIRILPNRLFVDFIKRKPVAYIKLYKYFSVDEDAVLFDLPQGTQALDLPVITGLETRMFGPRLGVKINNRELGSALNIIKQMRQARLLRICKLKNIDAAHPAYTSLIMELPRRSLKSYLPGLPQEPAISIEARVSQRNTADNIAMLDNLLIQLRNEWINIKYIDLRFKEPVIKFNDTDIKNR